VIRDVDMAQEMVKYSKNQVLAQAGTAMLAQASQASQGILRLFQ
jgi:flagellin